MWFFLGLGRGEMLFNFWLYCLRLVRVWALCIGGSFSCLGLVDFFIVFLG